MKLWNEKAGFDELVEQFTVGEDPEWDTILLPFDIQASMAHCRMLASKGFMTSAEENSLLEGLNALLESWKAGDAVIADGDEDGHTAIERILTEKYGDAGRKIHTGRSRNDQVLTALRLYMKAETLALMADLDVFSDRLKSFANQWGALPLPGYTHTRKAMPSSVGMWTGALLASLDDDRALLKTVYGILDKNPLGTGAGYGVPLDIDRDMTTKEMGFATLHENPIHAQLTRSKYEGLLLNGCAQVMADLNKMAADLIFYTQPDLGFFRLPDEFVTGSSIMPQKKNPDVLELIRGKYHEIFAAEMQVRQISVNLISGYHRDFQLTKPVLMKSLNTTKSSVEIASHLFQFLEPVPAACEKAMTPELFATARAYELVAQGMPFRNAYRIIAASYSGSDLEGADEK